MWNEIITLFSDTAIISAICLIVGLILLVIEFFLPGFGVFGITGSSLIVFALIFRLAIGGSFTQFLIMLGIVVVVISTALIIAIRSARFGLLSKTPIIESGTALPTDFNLVPHLEELVNKTGVTTTVCKPLGKIKIDDKVYQAVSNSSYLKKGEQIKVIRLEGDLIIIDKFKEEMEEEKND